jgi:hypothetical protein
VIHAFPVLRFTLHRHVHPSDFVANRHE